jgi:hypothetical protein
VVAAVVCVRWRPGGSAGEVIPIAGRLGEDRGVPAAACVDEDGVVGGMLVELAEETSMALGAAGRAAALFGVAAGVPAGAAAGTKCR